MLAGLVGCKNVFIALYVFSLQTVCRSYAHVYILSLLNIHVNLLVLEFVNYAVAILFSQVFGDATQVTQERGDNVLVEVYMRCIVTTSHVVIMYMWLYIV